MGGTPNRHRVLSLPQPLRFFLAYDPSLASDFLGLEQLVRFRVALAFLNSANEPTAQPSRYRPLPEEEEEVVSDPPGNATNHAGQRQWLSSRTRIAASS